MAHPSRWSLATLALLAAVLVYPIRSHAAAPVAGDVLLAADFEQPDALKSWPGPATLAEGREGGHSLCIQQPTPTGVAACRASLPVERMRGCTVLVSAYVRAENVTDKPESWNGIKVMVSLEAPGRKLWPQATLPAGSFAWRKATFAVHVPVDATAAALHLGLEKVSGKVWFDDIRVVVRRGPLTLKPPATPSPADPGHGLPRLRVAMVGSQVGRDDLRIFGRDWNANLIRWQITRPAGRAYVYDRAEYDRWLDGQLARLDAVLPFCREYGLFVALDLHSPPGGQGVAGGYVAANSGLFGDKNAQSHFVEVWRRIATRYKGEKAIWGFDLVNEPVEDAADEGLDDWHDLALRAGRAIREIDPSRTLIVEPPDWGGPQGLVDFAPLDLPNVVYSVHMYIPHTFTHQGVFRASAPIAYPGTIDGKQWNKAALEEALRPAIDFQKTWNVPIYIGEFSVIRWAPGDSGRQYLSDVIDIFEQHGWDWSYHAFREWSGWSLEHGPDRSDARPTTQPAPRQLLLREWYGKNRKPAWMPANP